MNLPFKDYICVYRFSARFADLSQHTCPNRHLIRSGRNRSPDWPVSIVTAIPLLPTTTGGTSMPSLIPAPRSAYLAAALLAAATAGLLALAGCGSSVDSGIAGLPGSLASLAQVTRGHYLITTHGCTDCHNRGKDDPTDPNWLAGYLPGTPGQPFQIGPYATYPKNLTPDATGIKNFTDR